MKEVLWPVLGIVLWCLIYGVRWFDRAQRRKEWGIRSGDDASPVPVPSLDAKSVLGAGWFVEVDGQRVAALSSPTREMDAPHWMTYVIEPLTSDPAMKVQLLDLAFWQSGKLAFRSRKLDVLAERVIIGDIPVCPRTRRITARGFEVPSPPTSGRLATFTRSIAARGSEEA